VKKTYFSVCTVFRDSAADLREWIEFHRLVGAERFFLYDNESVDNPREVLQPYLDDGTVVLHDWPFVIPVITGSIKHCLEHHGAESRWIAFLDIDEFLFSPTMRPLTEILPDYEEWPGVGVNQHWFGPSDHRTRPPGLVMESYLRRERRDDDAKPWSRKASRNDPFKIIKSIVDPSRVTAPKSPHAFSYVEGLAVDEKKRPIQDTATEEFSCELFRINHYLIKSVEEFEIRQSRVRADSGKPRRKYRDPEAAFRRLSEVPDEVITAYLPALKKALAER
jgi:hypothetical protein